MEPFLRAGTSDFVVVLKKREYTSLQQAFSKNCHAIACMVYLRHDVARSLTVLPPRHTPGPG
ncbi:hypothetical protein HPB50_004365 [Hyalomma asiaticum]|uniref:Uncharacterized protein n=1 Tax=Hyalomma asiaticum TaxID=266040 RepID=A0ACB7RK87_HYAAI|nr:hypothetical protein HPB50_004365 [Hyalomma asiaticum]